MANVDNREDAGDFYPGGSIVPGGQLVDFNAKLNARLDVKLDKADVVNASPFGEDPSVPAAGQAADAKSVFGAFNVAIMRADSYADSIVNDAVSGLNESIAAKLDKAEKGASGGVAELDENGKVPSSQLPSYVDDVVEYPSADDFPEQGESGKVYVATDTNTTYRWSGSSYVKIGSDLSLGETASTAYRGDRGKEAYDHTQRKDNPHEVTAGQIGLGNVDNTSDLDKPVSTAQQKAIASSLPYKLYPSPDVSVGDDDSAVYDLTSRGVLFVSFEPGYPNVTFRTPIRSAGGLELYKGARDMLLVLFCSEATGTPESVTFGSASGDDKFVYDGDASLVPEIGYNVYSLTEIDTNVFMLSMRVFESEAAAD